MRPLKVSWIVKGCSWISLSIKCSYSPLSIFSIDNSIFLISGVLLSLKRSFKSRLSRVITATSSSFKYITLSVYSIIGVASEAKKYSFSPTPMTRGLPLRAAISLPGSSSHEITSPYAPTTFVRARRTASSALTFCSKYMFSIRLDNISVSVSLSNLYPLLCNSLRR